MIKNSVTHFEHKNVLCDKKEGREGGTVSPSPRVAIFPSVFSPDPRFSFQKIFPTSHHRIPARATWRIPRHCSCAEPPAHHHPPRSRAATPFRTLNKRCACIENPPTPFFFSFVFVKASSINKISNLSTQSENLIHSVHACVCCWPFSTQNNRSETHLFGKVTLWQRGVEFLSHVQDFGILAPFLH